MALTASQSKALATVPASIRSAVEANLSRAGVGSSASSSSSSGGSTGSSVNGTSITYANPHDNPTYNPRTDPASSAYDPNYTQKLNQITPPTAAQQDTSQTPAVDTSQPSPETTKISPPSAQPDVSAVQAQANLDAAPLNGAEKSAVADILKNKYQVGFHTANVAGVTPPDNSSGGSSMVQNYVPPDATQKYSPPPEIQTDLDKTVSAYTQAVTEFLNPDNQRKSLVDEYDQLSSDLGVSTLKSELLDINRIMDGTEDDIRSEVTAASGFATESQVQAMTIGRNKSLLKKAQFISDQLTAAKDELNMKINLSAQDRQFAESRMTAGISALGNMVQIQQSMHKAAQDNYNSIIQRQGYDGLLAMTGGNPYNISLAEQTLGLQPGGLSQLATLDAKKRTEDERAKEASINASNASTAKIYSDIEATKASDAAVNPGVLKGMLNVYKSTGVLPAFGMSAKSPLRAQFYAALGADGNIVTEANTNKVVRNGLNTAYRTQQNLYSANQTAVNTLDKQLTLAQDYKSKLSDSGSPLINKYNQALQSGVFGDADTAALHNIVTTASYEFAKILSGASASISGVTVNSQSDAEKLLNSAMSNGQFNEIIDLMRKEAGYRLNTQKDTLDNLKSDLNNVGNLTEALKPIPPEDIPPGYYQASDGLLYPKQ